jgi:hypothetical protein
MRKLAGLIGAAGLVFTIACGQTDAGITSSVKTKLAADDMVKAYEVDVDTNNKVVTLTGDVDTSAAKEQALRLARDTDGVRDVIDQLRVTEAAPTSGTLDDNDRDVDVSGEIKEGAAEVKRGAKKAGEAVKDAVTDDDRDSDNDGK